MQKQKWEYLGAICTSEFNKPAKEGILYIEGQPYSWDVGMQHLGIMGWELCGIHLSTYVFKRPLEE